MDIELAVESGHSRSETVYQIMSELLHIISGETANLPKFLKPYADHLVDFTPPVYNVWKFKEHLRRLSPLNVRHLRLYRHAVIDKLILET